MDTGYVTLKKNHGEPCYKYFVVAVDQFTKWVEIKSMMKKTSKNIMNFILDDIVYCHGCPVHIKTEGGKPYVSNAINQFSNQYKITVK